MKKNQNKIEVLENAKIFYTDGKRDFFEAVIITDKGIFTGWIDDNIFIEGGFIPKNNIENVEGKKIKLIIEK
jgi:hypothetical protein